MFEVNMIEVQSNSSIEQEQVIVQELEDMTGFENYRIIEDIQSCLLFA